jgi:hypothetical protein
MLAIGVRNASASAPSEGSLILAPYLLASQYRARVGEAPDVEIAFPASFDPTLVMQRCGT